jgi:predicted DNA-binding transcriptional regulator AlpA
MPLPQHLTLRDIARRLRVRMQVLREWIERGTFPAPCLLLGGLERWEEERVERWRQVAVQEQARKQPAESGAGSLSRLAQAILGVLVTAGDWTTGALVARLVGGGCRHTSGAFRRAILELREEELIESDQVRGYRVRSGPSRSVPEDRRQEKTEDEMDGARPGRTGTE